MEKVKEVLQKIAYKITNHANGNIDEVPIKKIISY